MDRTSSHALRLSSNQACQLRSRGRCRMQICTRPQWDRSGANRALCVHRPCLLPRLISPFSQVIIVSPRRNVELEASDRHDDPTCLPASDIRCLISETIHEPIAHGERHMGSRVPGSTGIGRRLAADTWANTHRYRCVGRIRLTLAVFGPGDGLAEGSWRRLRWCGRVTESRHRVPSARIENDAVTVLDAKTGTRIWEKSFPSEYRSGISRDNGPRCVPLVCSDRVVIYSAQGVLRSLALIDGQLIWERDTHGDFGGSGGLLRRGEHSRCLKAAD